MITERLTEIRTETVIPLRDRFLPYPEQREQTGHPENILHPGIGYFDLNPNTLVEEAFGKNDAAQLSFLTGEEIVLPELVPSFVTHIALDSMSKALAESITDST